VAVRLGRYAAWTSLILAVAVVVFLLVFDWNWLKRPIESAVARATGRTLVIEGNLSGQWRLTPRVRMEHVRLSNPSWARAPQLIQADAIELRIALLPLLAKRIHIRELFLQQPEVNLQRTRDGRATWVFDKAQNADDDPDGTRPVIDTLSVDRGVLHYLDDTIPGALTATVTDRANVEDPRSLKFTVQGELMGEPVKLDGETASLLSLRDASRTLPLLVWGVFANTKIRIEGELHGLATPGEGRIRYEVSGPSLRLLESAFRVTLPETPRYAVTGLLVRKGNRWETSDLKGKVGQSDIAGTVVVETGGDTPRLEADLRSTLLDLADLGPLIGGTHRSRLKPTESEAARLLPTRTFDPASFRKLDAHVVLKANRIVRVAAWPFDDFSVDFRMNDGRIVLDPLQFGMAGGDLRGRVEFDASAPPIRSVVVARMDNVDVSRIAPDQETLGKAVGTLSGRVDLRGRGNSIGAMLASADGRLTMLLSNGNVPSLLPAIIDLDGARVLANLTGSKPESVRCSAIDVSVEKGIAAPTVAVIETDTTVLTLSGQVNLESEAMDLKLTQAPKKPSFLSIRTPILVGGTLLSPDLAPAPGPLAARAATAALLALINPLASVFALIETGPGEEGTCPVIQRGYKNQGVNASGK
jgi:uncharacterized protein involved in outer membrane biogenesis